MSKIKITTNSPYIKPKCLKNLDIQYGWAFYNLQDTKKDEQNAEEIFPLSTYSNQKKNIYIALFKSIEKFFNLFRESSNIPKIETEKFIFEQIEKNSDFLSKNYPEESLNLKIYVSSSNSPTHRLLNSESFDKFQSEISEKLNPHISSDSAFVYADAKYIVLGNETFNTQKSFFSQLNSEVSQTDSIDFTFFHEFSHSMQSLNNQKYGINRTNTSFDYLLSNLNYLSNNENYEFLKNTFDNSLKNFELPPPYLLHDLKTLHGEIYADIGSILLIRNKQILEGTYSKENIDKLIDNIKEVRNINNTEYQKYHFTEPTTTHFSSPGIEHLKDIIPTHNKVLTIEDIHQLSNECVKIGIAKTIQTLLKSNNQYIPSLNTLFSLRLDEHYEPYIDIQKNHYFEAIIHIKSMLPKKWESQFSENLKEILSFGEIRQEQRINLIFNAGLNQSAFKEGIKNVIKYKKEVKNISLQIDKFIEEHNISFEEFETPLIQQKFKEFQAAQNMPKEENENIENKHCLSPLGKAICSTTAIQKMLQLRESVKNKTSENSTNFKI